MKYFLSLLILSSSFLIFGQTPDILLDERYHHLIDREDIKNPQGFTSVKPYNRADVIDRFNHADTANYNSLDKDNKEKYILVDNHLFIDSLEGNGASKKPVLRHFYGHKPDLYSYKSDAFRFSINPMLDLKAGGKLAVGDRMFLNTRGVEVKGNIDNKVGFYSMIGESQLRYPEYMNDVVLKTSAVPGENYWSKFKATGVDFRTAVGYINLNATKHIKLKFGYDKNFIGDGYRSMILSNTSGNYTFLKLDTKVWKINYTNIFAELTADVNGNRNGVYGSVDHPKKYLAFHRLSVNIRPNLNIGFFESIIYGGDTLGNSSFDVNYLNPIIFYRTVESNLGSQGNALMGMDFKWNFLNHFSLYGQGVLDEFLFAHIKAQDGWWANKYAGQIGLKYIDVAKVKGLDAQLEMNAARPFIYSHTHSSSSYSHFNQALSHPLGANFNEIIAILRYQPRYNIYLTAKYFNIKQGLDTASANYGSNILLPNPTRVVHNAEGTGHTQLQGNKTTTHLVVLSASYMLRHNLFLEGDLYLRKSEDALGNTTKTAFLQAGLRFNLPSRLYDF